MPHLRQRHLTSLLLKTMKYSPITGVFGHRQMGKTTLIQGLASGYQSLDIEENLALAESDPFRFLSLGLSGEGESKQLQCVPFAIDECQYSPRLFPAMKEWVRTHPKPGQLLLSGSVRFTSRKAIRESLTGRIVAWELLPMDFSEIHQAPLPNRVDQILEHKDAQISLPPSSYATKKSIENYAEMGGMPGILFLRSDAVRAQKFETQINTILERDLKLIIQTTLSYRTLRGLLVRLAQQIGAPLDYASLSRDTRISVPTLKKLLSAFESMFLIRILPTVGTQKKPVVFFEDTGEANFLAGLAEKPLTQLLCIIFSNLRPQIAYRPELAIQMFQYRNRSGSWVPLCFKKQNKHLGIIPLIDEAPDAISVESAKSFTRKFPNSKVLLVHTGKTDRIITPKIRVIGLSQIV